MIKFVESGWTVTAYQLIDAELFEPVRCVKEVKLINSGHVSGEEIQQSIYYGTRPVSDFNLQTNPNNPLTRYDVKVQSCNTGQ